MSSKAEEFRLKAEEAEVSAKSARDVYTRRRIATSLENGGGWPIRQNGLPFKSSQLPGKPSSGPPAYVVEKLALMVEFDGTEGRMSGHQFSVVVASPRDPLIRF